MAWPVTSDFESAIAIRFFANGWQHGLLTDYDVAPEQPSFQLKVSIRYRPRPWQ